MTRDTHYDLETLAELAEGLLDEAAAQQIRDHLAVCDPCGESLADLAAVREVLAAMPVSAMPLGVAMRIDRALAAEASAPDWDSIMRDAPWESAPDLVPSEALLSEALPLEATPLEAAHSKARLGVVTANGAIVPARRKKPSRRPWALPVAAAAAAAVVVGGTALAANVLSGTSGPATSIALSPEDSNAAASPTPAMPTGVVPTRDRQKAVGGYTVYASGHNYTSRELSGPLLGYFGVAPGSGTKDDQDLDKCVKRFSNQLDRKPIGVDKANYNGNEATIMAFWEDQSINAIRVVVVDSDCKSLRPESLSTWN